MHCAEIKIVRSQRIWDLKSYKNLVWIRWHYSTWVNSRFLSARFLMNFIGYRILYTSSIWGCQGIYPDLSRLTRATRIQENNFLTNDFLQPTYNSIQDNKLLKIPIYKVSTSYLELKQFTSFALKQKYSCRLSQFSLPILLNKN